MYRITGKRIDMTRGDTIIVGFPMYVNGKPYDLREGDRIRFAVKKHPDDVEPCIEKICDGYVLRLEPRDTEGLDYGEYFYDVSVTFENGMTYTYIDWTEFGIDLEAH